MRRDHQLPRGPSETGAAGPGLPLPRICLCHLGHVCLQVQVGLVAIGAAMEVKDRGKRTAELWNKHSICESFRFRCCTDQDFLVIHH